MPAPKKTPVWVWILCGVAGFLVLMIGLVVAGGFFLANKAMQALEDPKQIASIVHNINPDLDVIDFDKEKKTLRVHDKQKDETYSVSLDDLKSGRLKLEKVGKDGVESVELGGDVNLPNWVPKYPGSNPQSLGQAHSDTEGEGGIIQFTTGDAPGKVRDFYKEAAGKKGLVPDSQENPGSAERYVSEDKTLHLVVDVKPSGSDGSRVHVVYGEKKKK